MVKSTIAAQLFTVRDHIKTPETIAQSFERLRSLGYEAVQLGSLGPIGPSELKQLADDAGLRIVSTHTPFDRIANDCEAVIEEHRLWECRHVAVSTMPGEFREGEGGYARFAVEASDAARPLVEAGLTFSYHNHSFELERIADRTGLEILFAESDPSVVSAEIDTYWIQHGGGSPADWLSRLNDRMYIVHVKDMAVRDGGPTYAEVGEGNLDWPEILSACGDAGIEYYIVEQDFCPGDPFESLGVSLRNLQQMGIR